MTTEISRLQQYVEVIQQANQIAASTELDALLDKMLGLIISITNAEAGTLYLYDAATHELVFKVVHGNAASERLVGLRLNADNGVAGQALKCAEPLFIQDVMNDPRWDRATGELTGMNLRTMYCVPLILRGQPVGVVQVFNLPPETCDDPDEVALIQLLCSRLVTEVEKTRMLEESQLRTRRQQALVEIISNLTSTLDSKTLLDRIMSHACDLLGVEATSIWLRDTVNGDLVLHMATGEHREYLQAIRVPAGQGIIGHVVATGETVVVNDVRSDQRFYRNVDDHSGFQTRAILCVPMRAPRIIVGGARGTVEEQVIGGAQALNPINQRAFSEDDISLFTSLASQAATVIRLARLYEETDKLFTRLIDAITGAIDLKDPYTRGHSQRVSDYSVAIAEELGLSQETIYRIRISSKLHDVGKIRIPDHILNKPDRLDEAEFSEMRQHPTYGLEFLQQNGLLEIDLLRDSWQALAQHHERLDGHGYPNGLHGDQISLVGRIVAVADVFDAISSHRPYRAAMPIEKVFSILRAGAGAELDPTCVEALVRARANGKILTQDERKEKEA
ncbi:GAF and HD-GYP domain-containing protein [Candidatus Oscillochloris fontis]|uniref:GAF and HD-GYP domain-containing protein n=1 Tax=Candidatus Oscillochloris fontis TaxID=2496868 RepID=UPI00101D34CA|nr:HD domain-containing phosphohydrolase [Candidatus Oscillochloris fontis]